MLTDSRTLILVADGRRARLFEESRRGGPLTERPEWLEAIAPAGARPRHAGHTLGGESGRDRAEAAFLAELASHLEGVFNHHQFDQLVLIAAPRALGDLRRRLPGSLKARLVLSEPHDRLTADSGEIEQVLRVLRRASA